MPTIQSGLLWLKAGHSLASSVSRLYSLSTETNLYESKTGATGGTVTGSIVSTSLGSALQPGRSVDGSLTTQAFALSAGTAFSASIWVRPANADTSIDAVFAMGGPTFGSGTTFAAYLNVVASGDVYFARDGSSVRSAGGVLSANTWAHIVFTYAGGTFNAANCKLYVDGVEKTLTESITYSASLVVASSAIEIGADRTQHFVDRGLRGQVQNFGIFAGALTSGNASTLYSDQFGLYEPARVADSAWAGAAWGELAWAEGPAAGATTHTTTGALSADAATIAGTASHLTLHATSGALAASAASIAGTATHFTLHATSGALAADAATVAGTAAHLTLHATTGALASDAATISGVFEHTAPGAFDAAGALTADAATIAGTAARLALHTSTGAIAAGPAIMAGVAVHSGPGATVETQFSGGYIETLRERELRRSKYKRRKEEEEEASQPKREEEVAKTKPFVSAPKDVDPFAADAYVQPPTSIEDILRALPSIQVDYAAIALQEQARLEAEAAEMAALEQREVAWVASEVGRMVLGMYEGSVKWTTLSSKLRRLSQLTRGN